MPNNAASDSLLKLRSTLGRGSPIRIRGRTHRRILSDAAGSVLPNEPTGESVCPPHPEKWLAWAGDQQRDRRVDGRLFALPHWLRHLHRADTQGRLRRYLSQRAFDRLLADRHTCRLIVLLTRRHNVPFPITRDELAAGHTPAYIGPAFDAKAEARVRGLVRRENANALDGMVQPIAGSPVEPDRDFSTPFGMTEVSRRRSEWEEPRGGRT
jgi:hypothetical protein